jgi:hypothetical protein
MPLAPNSAPMSGSVTRLMACNTPVGPNEIHGSDDRWKRPPVQRVSFGTATCVHVAPRFIDIVATLPFAPPFE